MLEIRDLYKHYPTKEGNVGAVRTVTFDVKEGEFFTLLGPSGCGKTTTLRCIAGLEVPDQGEILLKGKHQFSSRQGLVVPPYKRDIAMVFQSYAIWPHMSVFGNVAFPLEMKSMSKREVRKKVHEVLELVELEGLEKRRAPALSGGQQQRVALARAIIKGASVLLLDEPLSNLDARLRVKMRFELRQLQKKLGITTVYVTHDQEEALVMSDRIAVMDKGEFVQVGSPMEIYLRPKTPFVAEFMGQSNVLPGTVIRHGEKEATVETVIGPLNVMMSDPSSKEKLLIVVRPEHIKISKNTIDKEGIPNSFEGKMNTVIFAGKALDCVIEVERHALSVQVPSQTMFQVGDRVRVFLPPENCIVLRGD